MQRAVSSSLNVNNHTCVFLGGNHYSLGFSRSALWILPTISHRILKRCISLTKKMWKPQDRDLIKLRIFNALRTVLSETIPLNPPLYCGCLVVKSTMTISTFRATSLIHVKTPAIFTHLLLLHHWCKCPRSEKDS